MDSKIINDIVAHIDVEFQNTHRQFKEAAEEMISEYIKKYNLLVYGYYAFKHLNIELNVQPKEKNIFYQCYSGRGSKNVGDLINNLNGLGYNPVKSIVTHTDYGSAKCRIYIGRDPGITIIEITTVNPKEYSGIQKLCKKHDGMFIVSPLILRINSLNNIFNKIGWDVNYDQLMTLGIIDKRIKKQYFSPKTNMSTKIIKLLEKKWRNYIVFTGDYVYTTVYLRNNQPKGILAILTDKKSAKLIVDDVLKLGNDNWKLFDYKGTINLVDHVLAIKDGYKVLLRINICVQSSIPYVNKGYLRVANYLVLLKYYSSLLLSHKFHQTSKSGVIDCIKSTINDITYIRNRFLTKKNLIGTENKSGVFKIFCNREIELDPESVVHRKKLWAYQSKYGSEGYDKIKRMCEPLVEDF
jgi:hypothetical protein